MASAENSVQINVTFSGQEHQLSLSIRPSLELSDFKVDAAEGELDQALRRAFSIKAEERFYLHEAVSGRIMSKESFRDPNYCEEFPRHWYLVVEHSRRKTSGEFTGTEGRAMADGGRREAAMTNHSGIEEEPLFNMADVDGEGQRGGEMEARESEVRREREREGWSGGVVGCRVVLCCV